MVALSYPASTAANGRSWRNRRFATIIEQAKGIVAQARGVSPEEAFVLIRDFSRRNNRRLGEVADTIVTALPGLPDLGSP
ncbi:ANTAR domain-containing protein [Paractinoplanes rishiriensis]|uniref:ANTAR domain-containing protein n=1 Tax=Paractinoplanes rishiriensis TaxID=1050105 RepID=A0A919K1I1_9ACTN|nr:ANTAR domain-containing protein [Actinoplanes rishiriensis]GIE94901.1 hypothetical protein Ari01nite_23660 [Actinoplanes rishiriensis]